MEQLKLSRIPNEEIGERIKAVVYFCVHFYCFAYVCGQTFKHIITTPTTEIKERWLELSHALNEWLQPLSSDALTQTKLQSNLLLNEKVLTVPNLSAVSLSENASSLPVVQKQTRASKRKTKPVGFK